MIQAPQPKPTPKFCTQIAGRHPFEKFHQNIGQAKNAVGYGGGRWRGVRGGKIFEWKDSSGTWELIHDIAPGTLGRDLPWHVDAAKREEERQWAAEKAREAKRIKSLSYFLVDSGISLTGPRIGEDARKIWEYLEERYDIREKN